MTDRDERSDRFKERFSSGVSVESTGKDKSEQTANTSKSNGEEGEEPAEDEDSGEDVKATESEESIKDRQSVLMYLPDEVWRELDVRFDELNAKHKRQHGEALEKNRDYYPAIIQAGLNDKDLEEILDL